MKKISLLLTALSGAVAGYLFSNKKLREELGNVKDSEEAAKILARHIKTDGKKVGQEIAEFVNSDAVQKTFTQARQYAKKEVDRAKSEIKKLADKGTATAKKAVKKVTKKVIKKAVKTAKPAAKAVAANKAAKPGKK